MRATEILNKARPPVFQGGFAPKNPEWNEGDLVEMPLYGGRRKIRGVIKFLDIRVAGKNYKGLVLLGNDSCYYEFVPGIARKLAQNQ
jgi:hypothetical protein